MDKDTLDIDSNPTAEDSFEDNRIFHRFPTNCSAKYKNSYDYTEGEVFLKDASAQGLRLVSKAPFYVNDYISFAIDVPHSSIPLSVRGEVVWSKKEMDQYWNIGVKLKRTRFVEMSRLFDDIEAD